MKIRRNAWRGWVRLGFKMVAVIGFLYGLFGLWFGVERVRDNEIMHEGDLVLFCRIGNHYGAGDLLVLEDGSLLRVGDVSNKRVLGKVVARLSVRNFDENAASD